MDLNSAPVVFNDSQGALALAKNLVHHNASKHIEVRYHFIRDCVTKGKIGLEKVSSADNVANGMMKILSVNSGIDERGSDFRRTMTKVVAYHCLLHLYLVYFLILYKFFCGTPITGEGRIQSSNGHIHNSPLQVQTSIRYLVKSIQGICLKVVSIYTNRLYN